MQETNALAEVIVQECGALERLAAVLKSEHAALSSRDLDSLNRLTPEKKTLVAELEGLAQRRGSVLARAGVGFDRAGFESYLSRLPPQLRASIESQWQSLQELLRACEEQNQVNGILLDASFRHTQQALALLLGQSRDGDTYTAQGAVRGAGISRSYSKA